MISERVASQSKGAFPFLGVGVGLRTQYYSEILSLSKKTIPWFEAISENFMGLSNSRGGPPLKRLETLRKDHPIVLHGVSLSIGSTDPLSETYLKKLSALVDFIEPSWVSDHLCWTGVGGENLHDLLPIPLTRKSLNYVASRVEQVQEVLKRRFVIENVSSYLTFSESEMTEGHFLAELTRKTGCALLLDLNNVYVSSVNHGFAPLDFINEVPVQSVAQFHLAGHSRQGDLIIDTHDHEVADPVWELYRAALKRFGPISTLIEWDSKIPPLSRLIEECQKAEGFVAREYEVALETLV